MRRNTVGCIGRRAVVPGLRAQPAIGEVVACLTFGVQVGVGARGSDVQICQGCKSCRPPRILVQLNKSHRHSSQLVSTK